MICANEQRLNSRQEDGALDWKIFPDAYRIDWVSTRLCLRCVETFRTVEDDTSTVIHVSQEYVIKIKYTYN